MVYSLSLQLKQTLQILRAAGEITRLRLLLLLNVCDLTVKDLTQILGQSQPRISRHLKLLLDAGLIERFPEGSWVYYRIAKANFQFLIEALLSQLELSDSILLRDQELLSDIRVFHAQKAAKYFAKNAENWDKIRRHHVSEEAVETALLRLVGDHPIQSFLDVGTGTGRMLQLFSKYYAKGIGIDISQEMLSVARANLDALGINHAQIRLGNLLNFSFERDAFDAVIVHQVLHFIDEPGHAVNQIAKTIKPGGRLIIVDFAPHTLEFVRDEYAHRRLGFSHEQVFVWLKEAQLELLCVEDLVPGNIDEETLTVTIWIARDPRMIVADNNFSKVMRL